MARDFAKGSPALHCNLHRSPTDVHNMQRKGMKAHTPVLGTLPSLHSGAIDYMAKFNTNMIGRKLTSMVQCAPSETIRCTSCVYVLPDPICPTWHRLDSVVAVF